MAETEQQAIIIKRVKKGGHGHHGGAWKVAYADFVTAMMAFFLLLWLLNAVTQDQLEGISNYFAPTAISQSTSGSGGILGGKTAFEEGAMESATARVAVTVDLPPPRAGAGGGPDASAPHVDASGEEDASRPSTDRAEELLQQKEQEAFRKAEEELRQAMDHVPELESLSKSLMIDNTPEGLRIQIVDQEGLAMFPRGSADMYPHTRKMLELVAKVILHLPQRIAISGHTDATRYISNTGYSNWELSADRANASRRALLALGVPFERVARVVGMAATEPLLPDNPTDARNRRLSIVLLRGTGQTKVDTGTPEGEKDTGESAPAAPAPAAPAPAVPTVPAEPAMPPKPAMKPATIERAPDAPGAKVSGRGDAANGRPVPVDAEARNLPDENAWKRPSEIKVGPAAGEEFLPGLHEIRRRQLDEFSRRAAQGTSK